MDSPIVNLSSIGLPEPPLGMLPDIPQIEISGPEKAAILIITLGLELSSTIFKFLRQDEVERIVLEIAKITTVPLEKRDAVIQEAYQRAIALKYINEGGIEYAKEILERSFGAGQADDMTSRLFAALKHGNPLELIKKTEPAQLLQFIQDEHPQTIALILVYMQPEQAGAVLSALPPELQAEVAMRIAILQKTAPEVLEQLDELLGRRLLVSGADFAKAGGVQSLANVMSFVDRETEKNILDGLAKRDPELAQEVKNLLFVFEDIINLDDRSIQRILKEVDRRIWRSRSRSPTKICSRACTRTCRRAHPRCCVRKSRSSARPACAKSAKRSNRSSTSSARSKRTVKSSSLAERKTSGWFDYERGDPDGSAGGGAEVRSTGAPVKPFGYPCVRSTHG